MRKIKEQLTKFKTNMMLRMAGVNVTEKEKGDHLIEVLGVIIIAVIILIFFREQIVNLFKGAVDKTTDSVNGLFTNVVTGE